MTYILPSVAISKLKFKLEKQYCLLLEHLGTVLQNRKTLFLTLGMKDHPKARMPTETANAQAMACLF